MSLKNEPASEPLHIHTSRLLGIVYRTTISNVKSKFLDMFKMQMYALVANGSSAQRQSHGKLIWLKTVIENFFNNALMLKVGSFMSSAIQDVTVWT